MPALVSLIFSCQNRVTSSSPTDALSTIHADYYLKRGSLAAEAERAIILRLIDGVPQNYLAMIGRGWRAELTAYDRSEPMILLWHEAIEGLIKDKEYMKQRQ